jgi:hypothetical protein
MRSPVASLLELLARAHIPEPNTVVNRPTDELPCIRRVELDATDARAATFSNVSFASNCSTPRLSPLATRTQNAVTCGPSSTWVRSCLCADEMDAPICGPSREDMAGGPVFNAAKSRVKARRFPSSRSICTAGVAKVPANC